ncbi:MAG TPA: hypothetical protein VG146_17165 [Verrucomicrobiae bacterium]|nr:hypothetical protein [Verrucomicrobiae bacterium]
MNKKRLLTLRPHLDMSMIRESDSRRGRDGFAPELEARSTRFSGTGHPSLPA